MGPDFRIMNGLVLVIGVLMDCNGRILRRVCSIQVQLFKGYSCCTFQEGSIICEGEIDGLLCSCGCK